MGVAVVGTAAFILGLGYAVLNIGASRVFWAIFGYELGKRKGKR